MSASIWDQLEPLLGRVEKPARYIGCEDGAITPEYHDGVVSWLLAYPDTYETVSYTHLTLPTTPYV